MITSPLPADEPALGYYAESMQNIIGSEVSTPGQDRPKRKKGEVPPSDLFGLAMPGDENPLERA
jgi:hypothetical protein